MQAAGSVDHPLPPQSDAGGWVRVTGGRGRVTGGSGRVTCEQGRVTGGWGRVTGGEGQSLPQSDTVEIQMGRMISQWMGGVTGMQGRILCMRGLSG